MLSADEIDNLCKLEKAATPGPWVATDEPDAAPRTKVALESGREVASCWWLTDPVAGHGRADAAMIAAMRTALPELLAEVRRLREVDANMVHVRWLMERFDAHTVEELCATLVPRPFPEAQGATTPEELTAILDGIGHGPATGRPQEHD